MNVRVATAVRDHFFNEHERLEALFNHLVSAVEVADHDEKTRRWTAFESGLVAHMQIEEAQLIPALQRDCPTSARILVQEHTHIRARLAELRSDLGRRSLGRNTTRAFVDELRAHVKSENRLLCQWADQHLDGAETEALLRSFTESLRALPPPPAGADRS